MPQYVWVGWRSSLDRATTVGGCRTSLPGGAPAAPVAHDPTRTGTEFVDTAPQAQHDRPNRYHCGDRRTRCESASAFGGRYPRRVPRVVVLAAIAAALTGCGSGTTGHTPIVFGITGGNIRPYRVSIQPNGSVRVRGAQRTARRQIPPARVQQLRHEIQRAHLGGRMCSGVLPDAAGRYIRLGSRTVTVHGDCEAPFEVVWSDLEQAVGLRPG
jgi:hypothetical protein